LAIRYYNDAVMALDALFQAALSSAGAREELRAEAERLMKRGVQWRDAKYQAVRNRGGAERTKQSNLR
jgi:hypothetical protein